MYLSGSTEHLVAQLRDYPWKLLEGDSVGVSGRLLFAEQEAEERGESEAHDYSLLSVPQRDT